MNMLALMASRPPIRVSPSASGDRDLRLERAVALVVDAKYSVRKAAHALSLPKSTVHRYLQATRTTPASASAPGVVKRPRAPRRRGGRPAKCELKFLLQGAATSNDDNLCVDRDLTYGIHPRHPNHTVRPWAVAQHHPQHHDVPSARQWPKEQTNIHHQYRPADDLPVTASFRKTETRNLRRIWA